jgi:YidC/Oxa1 family membrane protein insertase
MRVSWLGLLLALCLPLGPVMGADAAQAPAAAPTPTAPLPVPIPAPEVLAATHWDHPEIANAATRVVLSTYRASILRMDLLSQHPLKEPHWRTDGDHQVDTKQPLAVLDSFIPDGDMHGFVQQMELPTNPAQDGTWSWKQISPAEVAFSLDRDGMTYQLDYRLDASQPSALQKPEVDVRLVVVNHRAQPVAIKPFLRPLSGVHQDDPQMELPFLKTVALSGAVNGVGGTMQKWDFPTTSDVHQDIPAGFDYVALKSRFFAAWWTPQKTASLTSADGKQFTLSPLYTTSTRSVVIPSITNSYRQVQVGAEITQPDHAPFTLETGSSLSLGWAISVSCMTKSDLDRLNDSERKLEFTDGYYAFFKSIANVMTWLLRFIAHIVHYYGLAVIILTFMIKAALHPLTHKQYESTMKMQKLQPELKYLNEQYKNDKQTFARKQLELYKKHGVNPLGGCLPMLVQIPLFIALYQSFYHSADMRGQPFLWISDLTLPDQLWYLGFKLPLVGTLATVNPLPILYILTTIWMSMLQKPPTSGDPTQEQMFKMMRWMPAVFGIIFYNMPAGLVLYFTLQAVLSALEIKMVKRRLGMP